ncbi:C2 domain-containing protein [Radiomyces spectabilis]|uniref:C2 domain-containing protein n=1 Tax=Radiomyces spectabilis TaxID=64574 RepID=UPI00221E6E3E|nr:C2 domain-containing protein [Radiomyces spectabilis]KAI8391800.1 C2 domain-containing protein [Radiomyces spectabilis]
MSNLKLRIGIISARGLAAADKTGFSDPYVVMRINEKKYTTKVIKQTLDPVWDAEFDIPIHPGKLPVLVNFTVWDKDTFGRDFLGDVNIPFKNVFDRNAGGVSDGLARHYKDPENQSAWYTLAKRSEKNNVSGEMQIKFGFIEDHTRDPQQYEEAWQQLIG